MGGFFMLSNRIGRFFAWILSVVGSVLAIFIVVSILENVIENLDYSGIMLAAMSAIIVAFMHQLNSDLLNFRFTDNIVFKTIKRVIFFGTVALCALFTYLMFYENGGGRVPGEVLEEILYATVLPSSFSAAIVCMLSEALEWEVEKTPFLGYISLVPSLILGILIAILGPDFYAIGGILVAILGIGGIAFLTYKYGWIYGDGPRTKKKPKGKPSTSKMPAGLFNKLYDEANSIASRYSGTKYLSYGMKAKVSGYALIYDESATIYVDIDVYMGGSTATSDWQYKSAGNEALAYQEAQMKKMYNELERTVNRLLDQWNYNVNFKYGVKPGHRETHNSSY
jgi:hypothetical protein